MTELLLRGPQTLGEIRTRASRMHPFADINALQPVIEQLCVKKLVEPMGPVGRGKLFMHTLYSSQEKQYVSSRMEKQSLEESSDSRPAMAGNLAAVEKLVARLEEVTNRIDALEQRLSELES